MVRVNNRTVSDIEWTYDDVRYEVNLLKIIEFDGVAEPSLDRSYDIEILYNDK